MLSIRAHFVLTWAPESGVTIRYPSYDYQALRAMSTIIRVLKMGHYSS